MMAQDWLNSALNITEDILAMARGYDEGNKAAIPSVATPAIVPVTKVVPEGMTAAAVQPNTQTLLLAGVAVVVLVLLLR